MTHTLSCCICGLVIARHNKIRDKLLYISQRSFTSEFVRYEPLIHQGHTRSELEIRQGNENHKDTIGDVIVRGFWDHQVDAIIDVKLGDANAYTYKYEQMISLLDMWENIKKDKRGKHCHSQWNYFRCLFFQWTQLIRL